MFGKILNRFSRLSLLPVRIALGAVFIAHGSQKLFGLWGGPGLHGFAGMLGGLGLKPAMFWALLAACGEFFGGILVLLGFYSRFGAFLITCVMVTAIHNVHWKNGFFSSNGGYEYPFALLGLSLCILLGGSGPFSLKKD